MVREPGLQPGTLSAYSESGQIPAYAVTSALVPISSNSGVSHFWSSMAITSSHSDFIVHAHRDVPFGTLGGITLPSVPDDGAYSSGSAKTKILDPRDPPISPGRNPSTQAPQPTGTAMYCLPSML